MSEMEHWDRIVKLEQELDALRKQFQREQISLQNQITRLENWIYEAIKAEDYEAIKAEEARRK